MRLGEVSDRLSNLVQIGRLGELIEKLVNLFADIIQTFVIIHCKTDGENRKWLIIDEND